MINQNTLNQCLTKALRTNSLKVDNYQDYFHASVLVPLIKIKGEISVLFEVRSSKLAWQPGEICFPGGRIEERETPLVAAVRETCEELQIDSRHISMIGNLNYLIAPIGVILYPFVGAIASDVQVKPSEDEVEKVFTVPLEYLLETEPTVGHLQVATQPTGDFPFHLLADYQRDWKKRTVYPVYFYQYQQYVIWGLTARVLYSFLDIVKRSCIDQFE